MVGEARAAVAHARTVSQVPDGRHVVRFSVNEVADPMSGGPQIRVAKASEASISEAGGLIRAGRLVAFPTETVYGLGADATNGVAVASIRTTPVSPIANLTL